MITFFVVVFAAIVFEYSNGFHDAANAIATVVSTKVLTPRQAIVMAAIFNLTGALLGGAVASTIGKGLVDTNIVTMTTVLCALIAAFAWNITTWWFGLPSSSSHALIGGLCGAALAAARGDWSVIKCNAGGWRIIRTPGHRMVKLQPVHGCAAETTAALIIQGASYYGIPLSTTHVISTSIMGVGAVKRFSGMKWTVVERIVWAWLFTLPTSGLIGYALERAATAL